MKRIAGKLRRIILLSNFSIFIFGKPESPSFSWFRDFWTCPELPKPILFVFGDTKTFQIIQEKSRNAFENIVSGSLIRNVGNHCLKCWKDRHRNILKIRLTFPANLEYGIKIFQETWNGILKSRNQETKIPRNQETFLFSFEGIPTTPQHTDPHSCTSPPLGGHEGTWGARIYKKSIGAFFVQFFSHFYSKYL